MPSEQRGLIAFSGYPFFSCLGVPVCCPCSPFILGRDITEGILYAPDALFEAITGAKEAEAKERAAKEFLAAVRLAVLNKQETDKAKTLAKEMGIKPEDEKAFLDCMCRSCGGSLGGSFNPACTSDIGHGPCQCNGPLTIWKTPLPMGASDLQYKCFNDITRMHYNQDQATFAKWRQRMRDENYNSVKEDIAIIRQQMHKGEFVEAADRFKAIRPLIEDTMGPSGSDGSSHNLSHELGTGITNGLMEQARTHAADPVLPSPLSQSVRKADKALELNPSQPFIRQQADTFKAWKKAWNETLSKDVPEIRRLLEKGYLTRGGERFSQVQSAINQGRLPPRHRDPQIVALEELLRKKRQQGAYTVSLSAPSAASPRPRIWQCRSANDCAMVEVGQQSFVTEEAITLRAGIEPRAEDMAYIWTVNPPVNTTLHCRTEPREATLTMRCPGVAQYQVFVSAQSGDGAVLGHASQQVVVGVEAAEVGRAAEQKKAYEAAKRPGTAKMHLSSATVAPKATISLQWSAQGNIDDTAWISLVPGDTPRGDINRNDSSALVSRRIGQERSGTMTFTGPDKPGRYELRFNDPTSKKELASVALTVQEAKRADPASAAPIAATTANPPPAKPATPSAQKTQPAAKATPVDLPSGWQPITLGYLQFAIPAGWQHTTESETWVEKLHIYWKGNLDNPDQGLTCGVVTNYNKAKDEMGGGSATTIAGLKVYRHNDGESDTLLFPPQSGTQGVMLMFYSGGKSNSAKEAILKTLHVQ